MLQRSTPPSAEAGKDRPSTFIEPLLPFYPDAGPAKGRETKTQGKQHARRKVATQSCSLLSLSPISLNDGRRLLGARYTKDREMHSGRLEDPCITLGKGWTGAGCCPPSPSWYATLYLGCAPFWGMLLLLLVIFLSYQLLQPPSPCCERPSRAPESIAHTHTCFRSSISAAAIAPDT